MKIMHCHFDVLTLFCHRLFPWKFIGKIIYLEHAHSSNLKINYFSANVSQTNHSDEVLVIKMTTQNVHSIYLLLKFIIPNLCNFNYNEK